MLTPRPEYPRPLLVRPDWKNLNGSWCFVEDAGDVGLIEGWFKAGLPKGAGTIQVPFPVESEASTIHNIQPASVVWILTCRWPGTRECVCGLVLVITGPVFL